MIRAIIIEDEPRNRKFLKDLLMEMNDIISCEGEAATVRDGIHLINEKNPELVFLDVELRGESGFDLLEKLDEINFEIIFTTAYEQYALKAIQLSALDYLLKPINKNELIKSIEKAKKKQEANSLNKNLQVLIQNIRSNNTEQYQLAISSTDGIEFIHIKDIIYCQSDGPYTIFYLKSGNKIMTSKNLKEYEDLLTPHNFFRVHHSYLINMREIKKYIRGDGGYVKMSNNTDIDVSKRKKEAFLRAISNK